MNAVKKLTPPRGDWFGREIKKLIASRQQLTFVNQ